MRLDSGIHVITGVDKVYFTTEPKIGPVAAFKQALVVKRVPKTCSGKMLRGTMKKIADGVEWKMPVTIDDPVTLDEITEALKTAGYPKLK